MKKLKIAEEWLVSISLENETLGMFEFIYKFLMLLTVYLKLLKRRAKICTVIDIPLSFDEMGQYDLPAAIAFVQQRHASTYGAPADQKVVYIGHSMGTTMFWASFDANQEFMTRSVARMIALAPRSSR